MPTFFQKHKKLISCILLISLIGVFGVVRPARAIVGDMVLEGLTAIMVFGIKILGGGLNLAVGILSKILSWDNFIESPIVKTGWTITRDLANMFFVLVLLMIAFGLILRKETYGSKKLLTNLIIAALLINFSLVIAGVVIDSSQVLTDFFITQSGGEDLLESNLMNATQAVSALTTKDHVTVGKGTEALLNVAIGALLSVIFLLVIFFVFAAYAFLLIVRIVYLWVLLIFAPIVWLLWTTPMTNKYWTMWWNSFIKWCFFAPVSAFFIYLSIFSYKSLLTANIITALRSSDATHFLPKLTDPANLVSYILTIALLVGGIKAAQEFGVYGANGAMAFVKGGKNKIIGWSKKRVEWSKKRAKDATTGPLSRATGAIGRGLEKSGIWGTGWATRQMARPLRSASETGRAATKKSIEDYEKTFKNYTTENLRPQLKVGRAIERIAAAKVLSSRGKLKPDKPDPENPNKKLEITGGNIDNIYEIAKKYDMHKDLLKSNLNMCKKMGEKPYEIMKGMKIKDMENISLEGIIDGVTGKIAPDVEEAITKHLTEKGGILNKGYLSELSKNNFSVFEKIQNDIIKTKILPRKEWEKVEKVRPDITTYLNSDAGKSLFHEVIGELDWLEKEKKEKEEKEKKGKKKSKIIPSATEEDFQKAKAEGYKGK